MKPNSTTANWLAAWSRIAAVLAVALAAATCSPGSLPGSPSPILSGGGGGRYDGTLTYRRLRGPFAINESEQSMSMALVLAAADQFTAQFQTSGGSSGNLQGRLNGVLDNGAFTATLLVTVPADTNPASTLSVGPGVFFRPRAAVTCQGRGEATGSFSGLNLTWTVGEITYTDCAGLVTSSDSRATATSPIPQLDQIRANVVVTILPGTTIAEGTCEDGTRGFPFSVEIAETTGIDVALDDTIVVEERLASGAVRVTREDNPLTTLRGGGKRSYSACSPEIRATRTYQAFFTGLDANANEIRFSTPLVTLGQSN